MKTATFVVPLIVLLLAGCATTTFMPTPDDLYPDIITRCQEEPHVDVRVDPTKHRTDAEKAAYVASLRAAWGDCHDKVVGIKERKDLYKKQYEQTNFNAFDRLIRSVTGKTGTAP